MLDVPKPHAKLTKTLKPVKLHELIGGTTAWTDERWDQALTYLLERIGTMEAIFMAEQLHHDGSAVPNYPHKVDFLREFRDYPPTVLLGTFDLMRVEKPW